MARRMQFELVLSEESCAYVNKYQIDVPKIAVGAVHEELTARIESERTMQLKNTDSLIEENRMLKEALMRKHSAELQTIIDRCRR